MEKYKFIKLFVRQINNIIKTETFNPAIPLPAIYIRDIKMVPPCAQGGGRLKHYF